MRSKTYQVAWMMLAAVVVAGLGAAAEAAEGKVNINDASLEQLALLPRVGPAVAQRIVDFREENGAFKAVEDLMLVRGIGEKTFEGLAPYLALSGETTLNEKVRPSRGTDEGDKRL
jgi:competence protein ComEA